MHKCSDDGGESEQPENCQRCPGIDSAQALGGVPEPEQDQRCGEHADQRAPHQTGGGEHDHFFRV